MSDKAQKAQMLYDAGLYRQADALVREAIAENPANAECFRLMSYVDLQLNRRTQAVQSARTAVSLAPDDYEVYVCLAFALYRSYQFEEAMHAAETALELCPDYAYGMAVASRIKQSLNDKEGALQYAEMGLAIDPDCDSCLKRKGFCSAQLEPNRRSRSSREKLSGVGPK
ncbi:MAG: tetratricopeptide repeat protein [Candidatus Obscuribacter sp.]|nr:tetratricopeptide repeat protein [Candidatus Obscuribacter sp.]